MAAMTDVFTDTSTLPDGTAVTVEVVGRVSEVAGPSVQTTADGYVETVTFRHHIVSARRLSPGDTPALRAVDGWLAGLVKREG